MAGVGVGALSWRLPAIRIYASLQLKDQTRHHARISLDMDRPRNVCNGYSAIIEVELQITTLDVTRGVDPCCETLMLATPFLHKRRDPIQDVVIWKALPRCYADGFEQSRVLISLQEPYILNLVDNNPWKAPCH